MVDQKIHVNSLELCLFAAAGGGAAAAAAGGGTVAAGDDDDYIGTGQWFSRRVNDRSVLQVLRLQKAVSQRHLRTVYHHSQNYMHCCKS